MKTLMAVLCLVLASTPVLAAESLISSHLGQPRTFTVHTPDSYASQTARYPVLYVLDGESSHGYSVAVADFLAENALVPEMIVVAVDAGETRMTDFMPAGDPSKGAAAFLGFLTEELVPYIDGHYRTAPVRILAGHSLGGLFVTHAFAAKPGAFRGYVAMSPYLTKEIGTPLLDRVGAALKPGMPAGVFYAVLGAEPDLEPVFHEARVPPRHGARAVRIDDRARCRQDSHDDAYERTLQRSRGVFRGLVAVGGRADQGRIRTIRRTCRQPDRALRLSRAAQRADVPDRGAAVHG
jgi:pimeloyl-ACP methyl ester carboxylesterase